MNHTNVEIKAKYLNLDKARNILKSKNADYHGLDHQVDTYFRVKYGRLKLREGNIENFLIYYEREDKETPKQSKVLLYKTNPNSNLKDILTKSLGILVKVKKEREIYYIDNIKFHLDIVENLGTFIEIEAINKDNLIDEKKLLEQCKYYLEILEISPDNLVSKSYSDLMLE
jgi:predicted adenylyl cyclase CyaB